MLIERHKIDQEGYRAIYDRDVSRFELFLTGARASSARLGLLTDVARTICSLGAVYEAMSPVVVQAIRVVAQANTAIFAFKRLATPPVFVCLGNGPLVTYDEPTSSNEAHAGAWLEGFEFALISRQVELVNLLTTVPSEIVRQASMTSAPEATYQAVDLWRAIWSDQKVTNHPSFRWHRDYVASSISRRSEQGEVVQYLLKPFLELLIPLEVGDSIGFSSVLADALREHRHFWSRTKKRSHDMEGFVSPQLTAIAAVAYDRGMRINVESEYIPAWWVCGELFRSAG